MGDLTGDGVPDFALGAPGTECDPCGSALGSIRAIDGATFETLWEVAGVMTPPFTTGQGLTGSEFGAIMGGGADINGDGYFDLVAEHRGGLEFIDVLSGATGAIIHRLRWDDNEAQAGASTVTGPIVNAIGDLNGDGLSEWAFGLFLTSVNGLILNGGVFIYKDSAGDAVPFCTPPMNSSGREAKLRTVGWVTEGTDELAFQITGAPPGVFSMMFFSQPVSGGSTIPLGSGAFCLRAQGLTRFRTPMLLNGAGAGVIEIDWSQTPVAGHWLAGSTWSVQAGFRDPGDPLGVNTTDALSVTFSR